MTHGIYRKEKKQMQNSMLCYNRYGQGGLVQRTRRWLDKPSRGAGKDTRRGTVQYKSSVYVQEILSHEAQKCVGVVGDKKER